ncbi:MAG: hypothetical protein ACKPKO_62615, partial [Candidatus Fonsibacter sp.]
MVNAHGMSARALTGAAMGDLWVVFTTGAASSNGDGLLQLLPARSFSALPASVVCDVATLEPLVGFSGAPAAHHKKEHLVAVLLTHQSERRMESVATCLACALRRWQLSPAHVIPMAAETTMRTVGHISGEKAMSITMTQRAS